jgi:hypothetical protein
METFILIQTSPLIARKPAAKIATNLPDPDSTIIVKRALGERKQFGHGVSLQTPLR